MIFCEIAGEMGDQRHANTALARATSQFVEKICKRSASKETPAFVDVDVHRLLAYCDHVVNKPCKDRMNDFLICFSKRGKIKVVPLTRL